MSIGAGGDSESLADCASEDAPGLRCATGRKCGSPAMDGGSASEDCGRSLLLGGGGTFVAVLVGTGGEVATGNKFPAGGCGVWLCAEHPWHSVAAKETILACTPAPISCATGQNPELVAVDGVWVDERATGRFPENFV